MKRLSLRRRRTTDKNSCRRGVLGKVDIPFSYSGKNYNDLTILKLSLETDILDNIFRGFFKFWHGFRS